ncbi:AGC family protein kinase [Tritrichomonas foetus]|uniref:non-specific serine/threonine protein kinase n=1 Tax=Tritrichomonas foetus TaxID=1144522 RepID=A0A1J4JLU5_9EUKA|nr:AGC family protein kinase [Tritrichomonas foetus]|eukprot:OHS98523.1 AGC family protein kinase [Tritrichomonas foetus]
MTEFKVVRPLGQGATSIAYLVECETDHKKYVIKEIDLTLIDEKSKRSIIQEVRIAQNFKHDNIIRIINAVMNGNKFDILMEYADKGTLNDFINKRKNLLPEDEIMDMFAQISLAVKYIHDRKILHRDLKTANIFISGNKVLKLGDFGFAKALSSTVDQAVTQLGTPFYLSPEICLGKPYSKPSDIWALGCILYEMCTKKVPFTANEITVLVRKIIKEATPSIPSIYCNEIKSLIKAMLNKDPAKRPSINQILSMPILKYKVIALLGKKEADIELSHSTFHGFTAGITPVEFEKEIDQIVIKKPTQSEFFFM